MFHTPLFLLTIPQMIGGMLVYTLIASVITGTVVFFVKKLLS